MSKFRISYFFLLLVFSLAAQSQELQEREYLIAYRSGMGFISTHSPTMLYFTNQHLPHYEFTFEQTNDGNKSWAREYKHANYGFGLSHFTFNRQVLGSASSIYPYMNFNLWGKKKIQWKFRTSIGLGYISKPFDEDDNYKNSAIGSHFNLYFSFLSELRWQFSKRLGLSLAADFSHFSNTSFKKPNLGINIPSINFGLNYRLGKVIDVERKAKEEIGKTPFLYEISSGLGFTEIYPANGERYFVKTLSIGGRKRVNGKSSLGFAIDAFHSPAIHAELVKDTLNGDKGWGSTQIGISVVHYLHVGKFSMGNHLGYYLKNENVFLPNTYLGVSGNYQINPKWAGFIQLKTHKAEAEYLLIGLRLRIRE